MPTNYLTQFATSGTANLPVESTWQNLTERATGFQTGLARSSYFNRLFAQGANAAYVIGQMVVNYASADADLDGAALYTNFKTALNSYVSNGFVALNSGNTVTASNWIQRNGTASYLRISGGGSYSTGGNIVLYGETSPIPGAVYIYANDGDNLWSLRFHPSGSVEVNGASHHLVFGKGQHTISCGAVGYVTTSSTILRLYVPAVLRGTVSIDALVASVRTGDGSFTTPGGSTAESLIPAGVTVATTATDNQLVITLTKSSGWGVSNNRTVSAAISTLTFTVS